MTKDELVQEAALRLFVAQVAEVMTNSEESLREIAKWAWEMAAYLPQESASQPPTSVAEQLDALVDGHFELEGWSYAGNTSGVSCTIVFRATTFICASATAPTFAEAAEKATEKAMAMIREGRGDA